MELASRRLLRRGRARESVRADCFEVHAPGGWNAGLPPVRNGRVFDLAQPRHGGRTAQGIDDFGVGVFGIHAAIIRLALFLVKGCLIATEGMPIRLPLRIAE